MGRLRVSDFETVDETINRLEAEVERLRAQVEAYRRVDMAEEKK